MITGIQIDLEPLSPELQEQLEEDESFQHLLMRHHRERTALSARHAQEYMIAVLAYRKAIKELPDD